MSLGRSPKLYQVAHGRARELRKHQTPSELCLWQALRRRKLGGYKFLRQHPILVESGGKETFIVADFYCAEAKLIVEVDGSVHDGRQERDTLRDTTTRARGYRVLRVAARDVDNSLAEVVAAIRRAVERYIQAPGF